MSAQTTVFEEVAAEFSDVFTFVRGLWNEYMLELHDGMTRGMIPVLLVIARQPGTTATEVSLQIGADKTIVSKQVSQLKQYELISCTPGTSDRRVNHLELSDLGRERIRQVRDKLVDHYRIRFEGWEEDDVELLLKLLQRFNAA